MFLRNMLICIRFSFPDFDINYADLVLYVNNNEVKKIENIIIEISCMATSFYNTTGNIMSLRDLN